jgi:adenine deaminase
MQHKPTDQYGPEKDIRQLMRVALGQEAADMVIVNGRLVNVYTGELLDGLAVCTKGPWIAYVGDDTDTKISRRTQVIDAAGRTIIPGLIDGHTHLAWMGSTETFIKPLMTGGTTTIVTESMEVFPVAGLAGVIDFLDALDDQPIKIFATAPFMASISRTTRGIPVEALRQLLVRKDIVGLGESYWQTVLQEPDTVASTLEETRRWGKTLEGHTAGAKGGKLAAYLATGISSCHEPITAEEVLDRLRLGIYVMIREGSIRRDLEAISSIKDTGIDSRRLILVTDGLSPRDLIDKGGMEYVVQKAIDSGFDPVTAIQMATLNVAEHFGLDTISGGIAPGRCADLLIIPDLRTIRAETVISNGRVVAERGRIIVEPRRHQYRPESLSTIRLSSDVQPEEFQIKTDSTTRVRVRVIEMVTDLVTRESVLSLPVLNGQVMADAGRDLAFIAAIDRTRTPGKMSIGLIKGFGFKTGALACSAAWDTSDIIVVGATCGDMARAVNRIRRLQGGAVVCADGEILAQLALPVFGLMSDESIENIADKLDSIKNAVNSLGCPLVDPLLSLITLTGAAIPYLRICEEGLVNLKDGMAVNFFVD